MLKSYGVGWGGGVVAHVILMSAQGQNPSFFVVVFLFCFDRMLLHKPAIFTSLQARIENATLAINYGVLDSII